MSVNIFSEVSVICVCEYRGVVNSTDGISAYFMGFYA